MKKSSIFLIAMSMIIFVPFRSLADMSLGQYKKMKGTEFVTAYVGAVGFAYVHANAALTHRKQPSLYCQPSKLSLNAANYQDILDKEVKEKAHIFNSPDIAIEMILLFGLIRTFPCE